MGVVNAEGDGEEGKDGKVTVKINKEANRLVDEFLKIFQDDLTKVNQILKSRNI